MHRMQHEQVCKFRKFRKIADSRFIDPTAEFKFSVYPQKYKLFTAIKLLLLLLAITVVTAVTAVD
jgi:hypothetical protein